MKVLRVINSIDPHSGGPIEGLKLASSVMLEAGVEVEVACLNEEAAVKEEIKAMEWPVHALGPSSLGSYGYSSAFKVWLNENLGRFDAVIIHGCWQYHGFATALACQRIDRPYYVYPHGMLDPWFNETYPLKKIKKAIYWRWGEHRVLSGAKSILFTCEEERRLARNSFNPYRVQEYVIGYGTTVPKLDKMARDHFHRPIEQPYFLFLGRIQEKKGIDLIVEAFSKMKGLHPELPDLVIAGPEQQPGYAKELKASYSSDSIHWIGSVDSKMKWPLLEDAEALVLVSHQENFGLVVAESLAMGTPVLISDKVNIWREIAEGGAGYVASDTLEGANELFENWMKQDATERALMKSRSKEVFEEHFNIRNATLRLIDFLRKESSST